jgi:hypothetical protein
MKAWHMILFVAATLWACNTAASFKENAETTDAAVESIMIEDPKAKVSGTSMDSAVSVVDTSGGASVFQSGNKPPSLMANRQIIRTAHLGMECKDYAAFSASVNAMVKMHNGWIESEQETQSDYQRQNVLQIKVPVHQFDDLMQGLTGLNGKLLEKKIASEDVTNAIVDTKGRIEAKKLIRARYLELLKQAKNMEDILEVQREINSITEDMETAAYNVQHMQQQAAYSTIYFTYTQPIAAGTTSYETPGFFTRLWEAIESGGSGIQNMFIVLAALWPLWFILAVVFIWWKRKRPFAKVGNAKATAG